MLATLGVVAIVAGGALMQVRRGLFDSGAFADRLADSLGDPRVAAYVAEEITTAVLREKPDLVAVRPLLLSTTRGAVQTDAFQSIVRVTAREAHAALLSKHGRSLLLSVPDVGVVLRGALAHASPSLAARIPARLTSAAARLGGGRAGEFIVDMWRLGRRIAWAAWLSIVGGLGMVIAGIALAPNRSRALTRTAIDLVVGGVLLLLVLPAGRALLGAAVDAPRARQAAEGLYDAFTLGVRRVALGLGGVGLVLAAATYSLFGRDRIAEAVRAARAWLIGPACSAGHRVLRGALFLAVGLALIFRPTAALSGLAVGGGTVLAFVGLHALFRQAIRAVPEEHAAEGLWSPKLARGRAIILLAAAGALAAVTILFTRPHDTGTTRVAEGCNGDVRLCARHVDEVAFAATHNAMSSADRPDWMFAQQERDVAAQLEDGVRAFLIDVYAGVPVSGRVKTDLSTEPGFMRDAEEALGKEGLAAADRIRSRLVGEPDGPRALYLCHGLCEVGAQPLIPWLRALHDFLATHRHEVVILVIEDYVAPTELASAFAESGLTEMVYRGPAGPPWPTLAEMAASGQQALTFIESGRPGVDWLHPAFDSIQETPYRFKTPSDLSCRPNRGGTAGSLFQLNHWIETPPNPRPSNAALVNTHDFLLSRVRQCQSERAHLPNIVAVDFYKTGDLLGVVRQLNGLE